MTSRLSTGPPALTPPAHGRSHPAPTSGYSLMKPITSLTAAASNLLVGDLFGPCLAFQAVTPPSPCGQEYKAEILATPLKLPLANGGGGRVRGEEGDGGGEPQRG
jgi:hypothetical protein